MRLRLKSSFRFDASQGRPLEDILQGVKAKALIIAFKSDWLYPAYQSKDIVKACKHSGVETSYCEIDSTYGHDAFLLEDISKLVCSDRNIPYFYGRLAVQARILITEVTRTKEGL